MEKKRLDPALLQARITEILTKQVNQLATMRKASVAATCEYDRAIKEAEKRKYNLDALIQWYKGLEAHPDVEEVFLQGRKGDGSDAIYFTLPRIGVVTYKYKASPNVGVKDRELVELKAPQPLIKMSIPPSTEGFRFFDYENWLRNDGRLGIGAIGRYSKYPLSTVNSSGVPCWGTLYDVPGGRAFYIPVDKAIRNLHVPDLVRYLRMYFGQDKHWEDRTRKTPGNSPWLSSAKAERNWQGRAVKVEDKKADGETGGTDGKAQQEARGEGEEETRGLEDYDRVVEGVEGVGDRHLNYSWRGLIKDILVERHLIDNPFGLPGPEIQTEPEPVANVSGAHETPATYPPTPLGEDDVLHQEGEGGSGGILQGEDDKKV